MRLQEGEHEEDARLTRSADGGLLLSIKVGLMSPRASAALALVLSGLGDSAQYPEQLQKGLV